MSERQTEGHRRQEDNESAEKVKTNVSGRARWLFSGIQFSEFKLHNGSEFK